MPGEPALFVDIPIVTKPGISPPAAQTPGAVGLDIESPDFYSIPFGGVAMIPTGLFVAVPEGYVLDIRSRSGLSSKGIVVANSPGTIDPDFRGELVVILRNHTPRDFPVKAGDRIAQMVLLPAPRIRWVPSEALNDTERGDGGIGSTG